MQHDGVWASSVHHEAVPLPTIQVVLTPLMSHPVMFQFPTAQLGALFIAMVTDPGRKDGEGGGGEGGEGAEGGGRGDEKKRGEGRRGRGGRKERGGG